MRPSKPTAPSIVTQAPDTWPRATATTYRDAIAKKHPTHLLLVETTGALSPSLARIIERLAAQSRKKGAIDHTAYGLERRSPKEFATHHIAAISAAIQLADVLTLRNTASSLQFSVSHE